MNMPIGEAVPSSLDDSMVDIWTMQSAFTVPKLDIDMIIALSSADSATRYANEGVLAAVHNRETKLLTYMVNIGQKGTQRSVADRMAARYHGIFKAAGLHATLQYSGMNLQSITNAILEPYESDRTRLLFSEDEPDEPISEADWDLLVQAPDPPLLDVTAYMAQRLLKLQITS